MAMTTCTGTCPAPRAGIRATAVVAAALAASPGVAQTMAEAAQANVGIALDQCLANFTDPDRIRDALRAAGFGYTPEDFGEGQIAHWFSAPADTVTVLVGGDPGHGRCHILTDHFGLQAARALGDARFRAAFAGQQIFDGNMEGGTGPCDGLTMAAGQRFLSISYGNGTMDPVCVDDGTAAILVQ